MININEMNMDLKDTIEASNSPKNELKEITLYQLVAPDGSYIGEPQQSYEVAWYLNHPDGYYNPDKEHNLLYRIRAGYKVIEVVYIPKN